MGIASLGLGWRRPPRLSDSVISALLATKVWTENDTIEDFIQSVVVISPSLGARFLHSKRTVTMEFGPEWLAFMTLGAFVPEYRSMTSPLSHYACPQEYARVLLAPSTMLGLLRSDADYTSKTWGNNWNSSILQSMFESAFSFKTQTSVARDIYTLGAALGLWSSHRSKRSTKTDGGASTCTSHPLTARRGPLYSR